MCSINDFDVVLFRTYTWIGRIIRYFINIEYNHAAIYYKGVLFESNKFGVDVRSLKSYSNKDKWVVLKLRVDLSETHKSKLLDRMLKLSANSKYDYWNLLIWQPIYRVFGKWVGKSDTPNKMLCSEFVARVYAEFFDEPEKVSPSELLNSPYFRK